MAKSRAQQAAIAISKMSKEELTELVKQVKSEYNSGIYFQGNDDNKPKGDVNEIMSQAEKGKLKTYSVTATNQQQVKDELRQKGVKDVANIKPGSTVTAEEVNLEEMKAGDFAKIKKGTKIALKGYGYVTVVDNDGVILKVLDTLGKTHAINLGQYNEKILEEGVSCCGRCGRVHESAQDCKKPYISKDSPRHCKNKK